MARLFLEISEQSKRVPASCRWDLKVRLVRPEDDLPAIMASDVVWQLAQRMAVLCFKKIDLTGEENASYSLKQGSIAPEIKYLASNERGRCVASIATCFTDIIERYLASIRSLDNQGWKTGDSPFYGGKEYFVFY